MKLLKVFFTVLVLVLLSSCQSVTDKLFISKSSKEKEIAALRVEFDNKFTAKQQEITTIKDAIIAAKDSQMRLAANSFYAQNLLFSSILTPVRSDLIWHNYTMEGWASLGNITPDYATMAKINERLKQELDESRTSLVDLQKNHEAVLAENQKLVDATKAWQDKLTLANKAINDIKTEYSAKIEAKQLQLNDIQNKLIITEKARSDDAVAVQALKTKISSICGVIVLACLIGVIYSPVGKNGLIILGAVVGLAGAAIWIIPAWVVIVAIAVVVAGLVAYALRKHYIESNTAQNVYRALESVKNKAADTYDKVVKPELVEFQQKYLKDGTKVPDQTAIDHVDKVLMAAGDK